MPNMDAPTDEITTADRKRCAEWVLEDEEHRKAEQAIELFHPGLSGVPRARLLNSIRVRVSEARSARRRAEAAAAARQPTSTEIRSARARRVGDPEDEPPAPEPRRDLADLPPHLYYRELLAAHEGVVRSLEARGDLNGAARARQIAIPIRERLDEARQAVADVPRIDRDPAAVAAETAKRAALIAKLAATRRDL